LNRNNALCTTANISKLGASGLRKVCAFYENISSLTGMWLGNPSLLILANRYQLLISK